MCVTYNNNFLGDIFQIVDTVTRHLNIPDIFAISVGTKILIGRM